MSAFLFIASAAGTGPGRRVNLADIANLFAEVEAPAKRRGRTSAVRIALTALILLTAIADLVLVARSDTFANGLGLPLAGRTSAADLHRQ